MKRYNGCEANHCSAAPCISRLRKFNAEHTNSALLAIMVKINAFEMMKKGAKREAKKDMFELKPWKCPDCVGRYKTLKGLKQHWTLEREKGNPGHKGELPISVTPHARPGKRISFTTRQEKVKWRKTVETKTSDTHLQRCEAS